MKITHISEFRQRKSLKTLEQKVGDLALESKIGAAKEIKSCFREWLKINARRS